MDHDDATMPDRDDVIMMFRNDGDTWWAMTVWLSWIKIQCDQDGSGWCDHDGSFLNNVVRLSLKRPSSFGSDGGRRCGGNGGS